MPRPFTRLGANLKTLRALGGLLVAAALIPSATAQAAGIAYIDGSNVWLSSPDGSQKFQVTTNGTEDVPWTFPAQAPDGRTVASHRDEFQNEDGSTSRRPVLYLFGPDGKVVTANLLPVYSGATIPVYPIGMDIDWNPNPEASTVAYGYSYCGFACESLHRGYWLTFASRQPLDPSNPQGQSDAYNPTYLGTRVVSSDSGGNIFVQPDVPEAPFTSSYQGWLDHPTWHLSRAEVAMTGRQVAIEWSQSDENGQTVAEGIVVGEHQGTVPSDVTGLCQLPAVGSSNSVSISPDGTLIAWQDDQGVKVAGAPNLAAGTEACSLSSPPVVISPTGRAPSFGGVDVGAILAPKPGPGTDPGTGGGGTTQNPPALTAVVAGKATVKAFRKGLKLKLQVPAAGRVDATASVPSKVARRLRLGRASSLPRAVGIAAAKRVVVARGRTTAAAAGPVTLRLKPTRAAKRRAAKLRRKTLTVKVSQGTSTATLKIRLR